MLAAAGAWTMPAAAAQHHATVKTVAGTVTCTTSQGALQLNAFACRPYLGYSAAFVDTGPANTPATTVLVGGQSDKANYTLDKGCSRTKVSVRFTHRGVSSAGVIKAGYNQGPMVLLRGTSSGLRPLPHRAGQLHRKTGDSNDDGLGPAQELVAAA